MTSTYSVHGTRQLIVKRLANNIKLLDCVMSQLSKLEDEEDNQIDLQYVLEQYKQVKKTIDKDYKYVVTQLRGMQQKEADQQKILSSMYM